MTTLMQASRQWATRPEEQRFTSLLDMQSSVHAQRAISRAMVTSSRKVRAVPVDARGLVVEGPSGNGYAPSHWSFGQLAGLIGAPAGYLRSLPAPVAADCINYGLQVERDAQDIGLLLTGGEGQELRAATGPRYGRVWNSEIVDALVDRFGDGVSGDWKVPGEFGRDVVVTKKNTTLFASDRDMFVFLADERNRVEIPNRRNGESGTLARGFFITNSEVGASTLAVKFFLFDYVCANRIVWGARVLQDIAIRHTASAPDRWLEEVTPVLSAYSDAATTDVTRAIEDARKVRVADRLDTFLADRFGARIGDRIKAAHEADEGRPMETVWDVVTGATAYARSIPFTADRVEMEAKAGDLLHLDF